MAPRNNGERSMRSLFTIMLGIPVLVCIAMGAVYALSDLTQGLFLIGVGLVVGTFNFFVLKWVLAKLDKPDQETPTEQEQEP